MSSIPTDALTRLAATTARGSRRTAMLEGQLSPFSQLLASTAASLRAAAHHLPPPASPPAPPPAALAAPREPDKRSSQRPAGSEHGSTAPESRTESKPPTSTQPAGNDGRVDQRPPTDQQQASSDRPADHEETDEDEVQAAIVEGAVAIAVEDPQATEVAEGDAVTEPAVKPTTAGEGAAHQSADESLDASAQTAALPAVEAAASKHPAAEQVNALPGEEHKGSVSPDDEAQKAGAKQLVVENESAELLQSRADNEIGLPLPDNDDATNSSQESHHHRDASPEKLPSERASEATAGEIKDGSEAPLDDRSDAREQGSRRGHEPPKATHELAPRPATAAATAPTVDPALNAAQAVAAIEAEVARPADTQSSNGGNVSNRLPEQLISRSGRRTAEKTELSPSEQNRFLQRVVRAIDAARQRDGEVRLRLSPPELGSLRLEVRMQQGALVARLEAETPAARALLIDGLPALRERLADQGIRIDQFDVDLLDRHDQPAADRGDQRPDQEGPTHRAAAQQRAVRGPRQEEPEAAPRPSGIPGQNQQINIIV